MYTHVQIESEIEIVFYCIFKSTKTKCVSSV